MSRSIHRWTPAFAVAILIYLGTSAFAQQHLPTPPARAPEATSINKAVLTHIEDNAPVRSEAENADEARAYDYIVHFASLVPEASFRSAARTDLTFGHLLSPEAAKYRGDVVFVEGRLKRIRDIKPTSVLAADGVKHLYEAWIFSDVYREYAWCVLFTELPPGISVGEQLDVPVSFAGYFYKIYRYAAGDGARRSPLLVGRTLAMRDQSAASPSLWEIPGQMIPMTVAVVALGLGGLVAMTWWYRRSDRITRNAVDQARSISLENNHVNQ